MMIALPIFHPDRAQTTLLNSGVLLTDRTIAHLRKVNVSGVWIENSHFRPVGRFVHPTVVHSFEELQSSTGKILKSIRSAKTDDWEFRSEAEGLIQRFVREIMDMRRVLAYATGLPPKGISSTDLHASGTCFLSVLLGVELYAYMQRQRRRAQTSPLNDLSDLAMAALVHDIGLNEISTPAYDDWAANKNESNAAWQNHVKLGYDIVSGKIDATAATAVLQHHQYYDQSGFPRKRNWEGDLTRVEGDKVHILARVLMAADQFDELKHHPDGTIWPSVRALRYFLRETTWMRVDPVIAQAVLQVVPAYYPGSIVHLSTGDQAVVLDWKPGNPCNPTVAIVNDIAEFVEAESLGNDLEVDFDNPNEPPFNPHDEMAASTWVEYAFASCPFEIINLAREDGIRIVEADGYDVSEDNFVLPIEIRPASPSGNRYGDLETAA